MKKIKVLNLYAGLGGNRKLWDNVEVTAVELEENIASVYLKFFPEDRLIIGDAHEYLLKHYSEFDFIWSSPPCQKNSRMAKGTRHPTKYYPDLSLYQEFIFLSHFYKGKFIIENVVPYYEPLIPPTKKIGRHLFWANFDLPNLDFKTPKNFIKADSPQEIEFLKNWLGLNYEGNLYYKKNHSPGQILRNCVHPEIGIQIFNSAFNKKEVSQELLFKIAV